jgi:anti-sigma factor RsiW
MRRRTARDLTALADGTLPPRRRDPLLRRLSTSPKLARALKQQLIAIEAIRQLDTLAPTDLGERIQRATPCRTWSNAKLKGRRARRRRTRKNVPRRQMEGGSNA